MIKKLYKNCNETLFYKEMVIIALNGLTLNLDEPELAKKYISDLNFGITMFYQECNKIIKKGIEIYF